MKKGLNKYIKSLILMSFAMVVFFACKDDNVKPELPDIPEDVTGQIAYSDFDFSYDAPTFIGGISSQLREGLDLFLTNTSSSVTGNESLLILSSLNELDFETLEKAYKNGATIAIENPSKGEFDAFFENNPDWDGYNPDFDWEDVVLYSFDRDGSEYLMTTPSSFDYDNDSTFGDANEIEEDDFDLSEMDLNAPNEDPQIENNPLYASKVNAWLSFIKYDDLLDSIDSETSVKEEKSGSGFTEYADALEFKKFADKIDVNGHIEFTIDKNFRKLPSSTPFEIPDAKVTVHYDLAIYPVHIYDGQNRKGNFFIVEARGRVDHSQAWKKNLKTDKPLVARRGGVYCHYAGYYGKETTLTFELVDDNGVSVNPIIPADYVIMPQSVNKEVNYDKHSTISIGGSASVSATKKGDTLAVGGEAKINANWSYTRGISFNEKNVDIVQHDPKSSVIGWTLKFHNTPYFDSHSPGWINFGANDNCRATQEFYASWVWNDQDAKDESDKKYRIKITAEGIAEVGSYYSTKADWKVVRKELKNKSGKPGAEVLSKETFEVETRPVGQLKLKNNFEKAFISDIQIWNGNNKVVYKDFNNQYPPGSEIDLGSYFLKIKNEKNKLVDNNLKMTFIAREPGQDFSDVYRFSRNYRDYFNVTKGQTVTLYATMDFYTSEKR